MTSMRRPLRVLVAGLAAGALTVAGCSSGGEDDLFDDGDPSTPVDQGTVVPPNDIGAGGGAPSDNLDQDVNEGGIGNPQSDVDNNQPSQQDG
ncbi:MAG: hypothetical protein WA964_20520 [Ilumatobacter sp.]|uniref:hypothetical protein n=1 Tax=Ilumatobacter sp. TaxID=1967498 RepID=UPI003C737485